MAHLHIARPTPSEYAPFYAAYVDAVPDGDLLRMLEDQADGTLELVRAFGEARGDDRYAVGKWSVKEVVGHMSDSERVFTYRALRFARADSTPLPGFEQNGYVEAAGFGRRTLADLAEEFAAVRKATLKLLVSLDETALDRVGTASGHPMSVRAVAWVIAGHERHHVGVLRDRYF